MKIVLILLLLATLGWAKGGRVLKTDAAQCVNDAVYQQRFRGQLEKIRQNVSRILTYVMSDARERGNTYQQLSYFVDKFGPRFTGTSVLETTIDYMLDTLRKEQHQNVHAENVTVPRWVRGQESASMIAPRFKKLSILGLGYSEGTAGKEIQAPIIVVHNFTELQQRAQEVKGKIVVYNFKFESYGKSAKYRGDGASEAAKHGAVAAFIRSLTSLSINSPHTGGQTYQANVTKIPAVSITVEDAELFDRLTSRGEKVVIRYSSTNHLETTEAISRNTVSELVGTHRPNQIVLVSGHLDSWDVGQGAMDDGAGAFVSWRALSIIRKLGLRPRQTIRSVLWTAEEMGLIGAQAYVKQHESELANITLALESDIGTFTPYGVSYSGKNTTAQCIMAHILSMLTPINATKLEINDEGSDVSLFAEKGVPIGSLQTQNERYFYFHHTEGDTMTVENSDDLDRCVALWASVAYAVASLDEPLPR